MQASGLPEPTAGVRVVHPRPAMCDRGREGYMCQPSQQLQRGFHSQLSTHTQAELCHGAAVVIDEA